MDLVTLRRTNTKWSIDQNPTTIAITRTGKVRKGGGWSEVDGTAGPFVVRVMPKKSRSMNNVKGDKIGTKQVQEWSLLADEQADIQDGPETKDEFDVNGLGHFVVKNVYPQMVNNQIVAYQVDIEKVQ